MAAGTSFSYYPGCSLHGTAREYDETVRAVFAAAGIALEELADWNCCGATSAHATDPALLHGLQRRNLELARAAGREVVVPCASCFNVLKKAALAEGPQAARIVHPLEILGRPEIRARLKPVPGALPLPGRVACYYGCLLTRPGTVAFEDPEAPRLMDELLGDLGIECRDWNARNDCCGAAMALAQTDLAVELVGRILDEAAEVGAEMVVAACPLCQANLETRQGGRSPGMPVYYFSELLARAVAPEAARRAERRHLVPRLPAAAAPAGGAR